MDFICEERKIDPPLITKMDFICEERKIDPFSHEENNEFLLTFQSKFRISSYKFG